MADPSKKPGLREQIKHAIDDPGDVVARGPRRGAEPIETATAWRVRAICHVLAAYGIDVDAVTPLQDPTAARREDHADAR